MFLRNLDKIIANLIIRLSLPKPARGLEDIRVILIFIVLIGWRETNGIPMRPAHFSQNRQFESWNLTHTRPPFHTTRPIIATSSAATSTGG